MIKQQSKARRTARRLVTGLACLSVAACAALVLGLTAFGGGTADAAHRSEHRSQVKPLAPGEGFGLDLLGTQPPGNVVVSPASVAAALAMAGSGADGTTAAQIATTLGLRGPGRFGSIGAQQRKLVATTAAAASGNPEAPTLAIANGLFVQSGFALKPPFVTGLQRHFGASPEALDFLGDPAGALGAINAWGSAHTDGIIPEMLSALPAQARLVLANAVYLKAKWQQAFEKESTFPGTFHRGNGKGVRTEFMYQQDQFRYGAGTGYKAIELPYRGSTLSLMVVLPVGSGVARLERRLRDAGGLAGVVDGLAPETVKLTLPRFHLRTDASLVAPLEALGMKTAFTDAADFSGIAYEPLKIGAIQHVADIDVDEEGTEAAATTGIVIVPTSAEVPIESVTFKADRPFLFFVRDDETGAVLFAGRLTDPLAAAG